MLPRVRIQQINNTEASLAHMAGTRTRVASHIQAGYSETVILVARKIED